MKIFNLHKEIADSIAQTISQDADYTGYNIVYDQGSVFNEDLIPALLMGVSDNSPSDEGSSFSGSHYRTFTFVIRIFLPIEGSETLENIADDLFTKIFDMYESKPNTATIGNPTFNKRIHEKNSVLLADLEVPIFYRTKQS